MIAIKVRADFESVRLCLCEIRAWLNKQDVDADTLGRCELVLAEALNNIVKHAKLRDGAAIAVLVYLAEAHVRILLRDPGQARLDENTLNSPPPDNFQTIGQLPVGGFGWMLIRKLARNVNYVHSGGGNLLTMSVPFDATLPSGFRLAAACPNITLNRPQSRPS